MSLQPSGPRQRALTTNLASLHVSRLRRSTLHASPEVHPSFGSASDRSQLEPVAVGLHPSGPRQAWMSYFPARQTIWFFRSALHAPLPSSSSEQTSPETLAETSHVTSAP